MRECWRGALQRQPGGRPGVLHSGFGALLLREQKNAGRMGTLKVSQGLPTEHNGPSRVGAETGHASNCEG
jgi:hypothetical protein